MVIGLCEITMHLRQVRSLKDKRSVVRAIVDRSRARFPVSIAETAGNDDLRRAVIGFSLVTNDRRFAESSLDHVLEFIGGLHLAEIVAVDREILSWGGPVFGAGLTLADIDPSEETP